MFLHFNVSFGRLRYPQANVFSEFRFLEFRHTEFLPIPFFKPLKLFYDCEPKRSSGVPLICAAQFQANSTDHSPN